MNLVQGVILWLLGIIIGIGVGDIAARAESEKVIPQTPQVEIVYRDFNLVKDCHNLVTDKDTCTFVSWDELNRKIGFLQDAVELKAGLLEACRAEG